MRRVGLGRDGAAGVAPRNRAAAGSRAAGTVRDPVSRGGARPHQMGPAADRGVVPAARSVGAPCDSGTAIQGPGTGVCAVWRRGHARILRSGPTGPRRIFAGSQTGDAGGRLYHRSAPGCRPRGGLSPCALRVALHLAGWRHPHRDPPGVHGPLLLPAVRLRRAVAASGAAAALRPRGTSARRRRFATDALRAWRQAFVDGAERGVRHRPAAGG